MTVGGFGAFGWSCWRAGRWIVAGRVEGGLRVVKEGLSEVAFVG